MLFELDYFIFICMCVLHCVYVSGYKCVHAVTHAFRSADNFQYFFPSTVRYYLQFTIVSTRVTGPQDLMNLRIL